MQNATKPNANRVDKLSKQHRVFIERQNNCALCSTQLEISVVTYLEDYTLREEAKCPHCNLITRVKDHKMH
ncbi:MAG: hypothetical protein H6626_05170 [Pseudobdellovibrionaceae bacterium]|nr:MAG: hypothetical protein H6626_05170 [Pseudobdellovibrionaceae bacterium]